MKSIIAVLSLAALGAYAQQDMENSPGTSWCFRMNLTH